MKITSEKVITVSVDEAGQRIDNFLHTKLHGVPRSMIYRILRKGEVRVNKKRIKPKYKLVFDDRIRLPPIRISKCRKKIVSPKLKKDILSLSNTILYEDEYILVLNKPSGMAVHGGSKLNFGIIEGLRVLRPEAHFLELVHRLDRDTSGALLIAKKRSTLCSLHNQLRAGKIEKNYLALVRGRWPSHVKVVQAPLKKNILKSGEWVTQVNKTGKFSKTYFKIKEHYNTLATLVHCNPITGRTHQIRVHAQYIGHPIAFDDRYGDHEFNKRLLQMSIISHLCLHATDLRFAHPNTGETINIEAPMDDQLKRSIRILRTNSNH